MSDWKRKRRRAALWRQQQGKCHWCGEAMMHWNDWYAQHRDAKGGWQPPRLATIDHLRDRFDPTRQIPARGSQRLVLACRQCNHQRGVESQRQQPLEELQRRAKRGDIERGGKMVEQVPA